MTCATMLLGPVVCSLVLAIPLLYTSMAITVSWDHFKSWFWAEGVFRRQAGPTNALQMPGLQKLIRLIVALLQSLARRLNFCCHRRQWDALAYWLKCLQTKLLWPELWDQNQAPISMVNAMAPTFAWPESLGGPYGMRSPAEEFPLLKAPGHGKGVEGRDTGLHSWLDKNTTLDTYFLLLCAKLAYEDDRVIEKEVKAWGFQDLCILNPAEDQDVGSCLPRSALTAKMKAYIVSTSEAIIIAFRGAQPLNLLQWFTDLDANPVQLGGASSPRGHESLVTVHEGFMSALTAQMDIDNLIIRHGVKQPTQLMKQSTMFAAVMEHVKVLMRDHPDSPVYLAGHSLGGGLASMFGALCNRRMASEGCREVAVIGPEDIAGIFTFGQPRCGNIHYATAFDKVYSTKCYRFKHATDVVPWLPLNGTAWWHHGQLVYIDSGNDFYIGDDHGTLNAQVLDHVTMLPRW
eukprot:CAMPEP_0174349208 /NCGR_PEP_ID=MMETSP0811_2-20130205/5876_1 /TAXON_ID=73025 ORGANISM="Eutreptiella gymnastica-like, Strain CCMP1594" /NCGR_SAMPLE_ID=MMETSP0811_2 /ASSEMBLY_ACC=CAM_ASM_000667 /LENGTH=459 /DNA_ID=CAMNT_0015476399 /DNA_START=71 /DNA_END=1447 /DNA_ORIENTATION=+